MKTVFGILMVIAIIALVLFFPAIILSLALTQLTVIHAPQLSIWECWCFLASVGITGAAFNGISYQGSKD
jgi:apolipoprotein N-acyltransferase